MNEPLLLTEDPPRPRGAVRAMKEHALLLSIMLATMWAIEIADLLPFADFDRFGIQPRSLTGLLGLFCMPFLHAGFAHLIANSLPFVILGAFVLLGGRTVFWSVTLLVMFGGGFGVWLFAPKFTNHIGASGLIFGYLGFLLARGIFEKSPAWILLSCAILGVYGGLLWGVLPLERGISWQAHLFGFIAGIIAARLLFHKTATVVR